MKEAIEFAKSICFSIVGIVLMGIYITLAAIAAAVPTAIAIAIILWTVKFALTTF